MVVQRLTHPTALVLEFLLECHKAEDVSTWGFEVSKATGLKGGTVYPLLNKLLADGWVEAEWDESAESGPRRRMYKLTSSGAAAAAELLVRRRATRGEVTWAPTF
jgi:DNA-binding PadR family transcriptional regulator